MTQTIELDCAPGWPRPGDLIDEVVKGTPLEGLPEAHRDNTTSRLFGCWTWSFPNIAPIQWRIAQALIKPRIDTLYRKGVIRYGSW